MDLSTLRSMLPGQQQYGGAAPMPQQAQPQTPGLGAGMGAALGAGGGLSPILLAMALRKMMGSGGQPGGGPAPDSPYAASYGPGSGGATMGPE
jgi:hypothetical protein